MSQLIDWHSPKINNTYQTRSAICQIIRRLGFRDFPEFKNGGLTVSVSVGFEQRRMEEMMAEDVLEVLTPCQTYDEAIVALLGIEDNLMRGH